MKEEIKVVGLEGMNYMFVFDEFRPREEMEVKVYVDDLFNAVFNKEYDLFKGLFFSKIEVPGGEDISYRTVIKKLKLFAEAFDEIKVERADFTIDRQFADEAKVTCDIEFVATIQGSRETVPFSGIAKFFMVETSDLSLIHI